MNETIFNLEGKVALVTGGGTGVGASIAMALSKAGAKVALAARRVEKLKETEESIIAQGGVAKSFSLDVSSEVSLAVISVYAKTPNTTPTIIPIIFLIGIAIDVFSDTFIFSSFSLVDV